MPDLYLCPRCGKNTVHASISAKKDIAVVVCSNCGLSATFLCKPSMEVVDAYCLFVDSYYGVEPLEEPTIG